ncbi:MAG: hypothetical protein J2P37_24200, partial [Ktedonobacteraceae bacterium]|nr:hypothetical protein [Ktedonobacteraceae bacterium]
GGRNKEAGALEAALRTPSLHPFIITYVFINKTAKILKNTQINAIISVEAYCLCSAHYFHLTLEVSMLKAIVHNPFPRQSVSHRSTSHPYYNTYQSVNKNTHPSTENDAQTTSKEAWEAAVPGMPGRCRVCAGYGSASQAAVPGMPGFYINFQKSSLA